MQKFLPALVMLLLPLPGFGNSILDGLEFKHGIAFFHDLKYPGDYTHLDYLNPDAPKGGMLVEPTQSNFNTLAPRQPGGTVPPSGFWFTYDTLLIRAGDEVSAFYGRLADGVAITDDKMAIVFRIHPDARWQDGVPITATDVAYTYRLNKNDVQSAIWYEFMDSIEVIDDRHVVIHLTSPVTLNSIIIIQFTSIMPEHYWRDRDPTARTLEPPLFSGPYRISDIKQGKYIEYELDPNYWGRDIPVNKGRYNFKKVRYEVYRDATVIREAFRKGLLDIWTESDVRYWHSAYETPALEKGWIKKIRRHYGVEVGVRRSIALNNRLEKFADRRVRQALTLAMDFEWQNRTLHNGYHKRAHSYWPDTLLAATDLPTEDELALLAPFRDQLPPALFERPFRFPEAATNEAHREVMLVARQLLNEAGFRLSDGVLRNQKGDALEIEFLTQNAEDARILLPYFKQLEYLGIAGSMRLAESSQYINRLRQFDFDAVMKNQDIHMPPVIELKSTYHSTSAFEPTTRNVAGISDPAIDALVTHAMQVVTMEEMIASCRALDRVLLWQYYQIPLYAVDLRRTVHWDKFGLPAPEARYWPAFPDGWWYDEKKASRIHSASSL